MSYAWHHCAADFGGISATEQPGVAAQPITHATSRTDMRDHAVSVVRWWLVPDLRGDGVVFDQEDRLVGLSAPDDSLGRHQGSWPT